MEFQNCTIGFMQGRLTELVDNKIQAFPWKKWEEEFEIASVNLLKAMEWTIDAEDLYRNPLMNSEGRKKIQFLKRKYRLLIPSLTGDCFMQKPFWKTEGKIQSNLENDFIKVCENASKIDIKYIIVPLVDNGSISNKNEELKLINFFCKIENKIENLNIKIVFETDFSPKRNLEFINQLNKDIFGINYDMGNSACNGFDPKEEIILLSERIWNVHIKDRKFRGSTVELGKGDVDFNKVFFYLSKINYRGNLILQTARSENNDHLKVILKYKKLILSYLKTFK